MSTSPKHADGPFSISNQSAAASGKEKTVRLWSCMGVQQMTGAAGPGVGGRCRRAALQMMHNVLLHFICR